MIIMVPAFFSLCFSHTSTSLSHSISFMSYIALYRATDLGTYSTYNART